MKLTFDAFFCIIKLFNNDKRVILVTKSFEQMLYFFGAGAHCGEYTHDGKINVDEIRKLSIEQGIWPVVYSAMPSDIREKYSNEILSTIILGISINKFTLDIIKHLENQGIKCCLIKGVTVSSLYKEPDSRISGDTDILINPDDEKKAIKVLLKKGYKIQPREKTGHHFKAIHKNGGILEVHVRLHSIPTEKILFNGENLYFEEYRNFEMNGYNFKTLGINDGLMYLTAHYIKHLINEGGGVRQMMDLLLYIERYKDEIDFKRYDEMLKKLRYDHIFKVIKSIGGKYFGFNYSIEDEDLIEKIIDDTEDGGIFGQTIKDRKDFYKTYCSKRTNMTENQFKIFFATNDERNIFKKILPSKKDYINIYDIKYAKHIVLMPVAWFHRIFKIISRKHNEKINPRNLDKFNERMELMKELGMID